MTIDIKALSQKDLEVKIEQTASALKRYEEELKARKRPTPLGVPAKGVWHVSGFGNVDSDDSSFAIDHYNDTLNCFPSEISAKKHAEMTFTWRKALVAVANEDPVDIEVLKPFLKKGWVAMDKSGNWFWYANRPVHELGEWNTKHLSDNFKNLNSFNIKPAEDWTKSLQECGL